MQLPSPPRELFYAVPGSVAEHRLKVQQSTAEREAVRASELAAQVSPARDAEERIRIWERLHALQLPRSSGHVLVRVIAAQTRLTIGQVHEEQRRRAAPIAQQKAVMPEGGAVLQSEPAKDADTAARSRDV